LAQEVLLFHYNFNILKKGVALLLTDVQTTVTQLNIAKLILFQLFIINLDLGSTTRCCFFVWSYFAWKLATIFANM